MPGRPDSVTSQGNVAKCMLVTVDVEDWFQVENLKSCIPASSWPVCEIRVERNTHSLLDFFDRMSPSVNVSVGQTNSAPLRATFFVLGWVAERVPQLVREIHARGHEVASHGYGHSLCYQCTTDDLARDLSNSKKLLEDIIGAPVNGYRAPSFSISEDALRIIEACGFRYDSSFNSFGGNARYGKLDLVQHPRVGIAHKISDSFYEMPISNLQFYGFSIPFGGGGYFRLIPAPLFALGVRSILRNHDAYLFYMHPWEIDPGQPRMTNAPRFLKWRHYCNLDKSLNKLGAFINHFKQGNFVTCSQYLGEMTLTH